MLMTSHRLAASLLALAVLAVLAIPASSGVQALLAPLTPLGRKSDSFEGTSLSPKWEILHGELAEITVAGGALHMRALVAGPDASWYNDGEGPLVYQWVTGDFTATTTAYAFASTNPSRPPSPDFRLGGLSIRDPGAPPGAHNWAHVAVGAGSASVPIAVEDKTTSNSQSDLILYPIATADAELRLTRRGDQISLYYRPIGAPDWQLLRTHAHPEFPRTVQVGLHVNSWTAPPDVEVAFDEIVFTAP